MSSTNASVHGENSKEQDVDLRAQTFRNKMREKKFTKVNREDAGTDTASPEGQVLVEKWVLPPLL